MTKRKLLRFKLGDGIKNHFINGIVVFASVFFAFWLTEVRENKKIKNEINVALKAIANEMSYNHDRILKVYDYHYHISFQVDSIWLNHYESFFQLFGYNLDGWQGVQLPMLRSTAYMTLINSGLINKLSFETQKALADIYTVQKLIEDADNSMMASFVGDMDFARLDRVKHFSGLFIDILPDIIWFYQNLGRPIFGELGYPQVLEEGLIETAISRRFGENNSF